MPHARITQPWLWQPQRPVRISRKYGPVQMMINPGAGPLDLLTTRPIVAAGVAGTVPGFGALGHSLDTTASDGSQWSSADCYWQPHTSEFTLEVLVALSSTNSLMHIFGVHDLDPTANADNGARRGLLSFGGGSSDDIYFWGDGADLDSGVRWRVDGLPQHVFVTALGGTMRFYRDGLLVASGSTPALIAFPTLTSIYIGGRHASGSVSPTMKLFKGSFRNHALSAEQIAELTLNPWADFEPVDVPIYWQTAAGGFQPAWARNANTVLVGGRLAA